MDFERKKVIMNDTFDISMIDMTQKVPELTSPMLVGGGLVILSAFLVLMFVIFVRYKAKIGPLLLGVAGYITFIFLGSNLIIGVLPEFVSINGKVSGMQICVTAIILTLFYTCARICIANIMKDRYKGPGDVLAAGIGLGIGDGAVYGVTTIMTLQVLATSINQTGMKEILDNMGLSSAEALQLYESSISPLLMSPSVVWLLTGISLVMDMIMNIGLMMISCGVANGKLQSSWYGICAAVNFAMLLPFTFNTMNYTSLVQAVIPFVIKAVMFAAVVYAVINIDNRYLGSILKADLKGYTYERMPHFGNLRRK